MNDPSPHSGRALPVGTVTFLLADVDGGADPRDRLLEPPAQVLAWHTASIVAEVERRDGDVVRGQGTAASLLAAFTRASDAVLAAAEIHVRLVADLPPRSVAPRVRIALATGEADLRDGVYVGDVLDRCARLGTIARGGQVLLATATQALVRTALPAGLSLRYVGEHQLSESSRPERIFELVRTDRAEADPPVRAPGTRPSPLPIQPTSFVGRTRELADVQRLLQATRLLTLTGVGGVGKIRLALQVAADLPDGFPDGVWLVELAPLGDPALLLQTVASAVGLREEPGTPLLTTLVRALRTRQGLLVLDNCEHLLAACAELAASITQASPLVRIVATSREALSIAGEIVYRVPALGLPEPGPDRSEAAVSAALRATVGIAVAPVRQEQVDGWLERARVTLGEPAATTAWLAGQMVPLNDALAAALA